MPNCFAILHDPPQETFMHPSIARHLSRLVDRLADLRVRLREAARDEVARAVADSLAEATRSLFGVPPHALRSFDGNHPDWDDPWDDPDEECFDEDRACGSSSSRHVGEADESAAPPRVATALMTAIGVARWSYCRTGQPIPSLVIAALAAGAVLLFSDHSSLVPEVFSAVQELLPRLEDENGSAPRTAI
jgi:hypothetical protein